MSKELDLADFDDGRTWLVPEYEGGRRLLPHVLYPFGQHCSVVGNENVSAKWHWLENGPGNGHEHGRNANLGGKKNESDGVNVNDNVNTNGGVNGDYGENVNGDGSGRESGFGRNVDEVYPQCLSFFPAGLHSSLLRRPVWVSCSLQIGLDTTIHTILLLCTSAPLSSFPALLLWSFGRVDTPFCPKPGNWDFVVPVN